MHSKKGFELSFNTVIVAIICLVVLVVIIAIFTGSISKIVDKFNQNTDNAGKKTEESINNFNIFGCKDGQVKCQDSQVMICAGGEWSVKETCNNGCKENSCT
jgi:hypothetical protein